MLPRPCFLICLIFLLVGLARSQQAEDAVPQELGFARHLYAQGEYALAVEEFERIQEAYPANPWSEEVSFLMADCYVQLRQWKRAKTALQKYLIRYPASTSARIARYRLAAASYESGELTEARKLYLQVARERGPEAGEALYWAGEATLSIGAVDKAATLFEEAAEQLAPGELRAWALRRQAYALERTGSNSAAVAVLRRLISSRQTTPEDFLSLSRLLIALGRPSEATEVLGRLKSRWPEWMDSARAREVEARALWDSGDTEQAIDLLRRLPQEHPRLLGWMLVEAGHTGEAVDVLLPAMSMLEGKERGEAAVLLAAALRDAGRPAQAESLLAIETAGITEPRFLAQAVLRRGELLADLGRSEDAQAWLRKGLKLLPGRKDSCTAWALLADVEVSQGAWLAARDLYIEARKLATDSKSLDLTYRAALAAFKAEEWSNAQALAESVAAWSEESLGSRAAYWAGEAASKQGEYEVAAAWYRRAMEGFSQGEDRALAAYGLGWALLSLGELKEASETFDQVAVGAPSSALSARAFLRKGDLFLIQGKYDEAISEYAKAAKTIGDPSVGDEAGLKLGRAMALAGDTGGALTHFEQLYRASPSGDRADDALFAMAEVLFGAGRFQEAHATYQRVLDLKRDRVLRDDALYRIGDCLYNQGAYRDALATYLRVVRIYPESDLWAQAVQGALWAALQADDADRAIVLADSLSGRASSDPARRVLATAKAELLFGLERFAEAWELFSKLSDEPETAMRAAWCQERMGKTSQAARAFMDVAKKWPDAAMASEALYQASTLARKLGRLRESVTLLERLLSDYPGSDVASAARYDLGSTLYEAGRKDLAQASWVDLVGRSRGEWERKARLRLGELQMEAGLVDSALAWIRPLLTDAEGEQGAQAHWIAAEAELQRGNTPEARRLFLRLSYLFPESSFASMARDRALSLVKEKEEAAR